MAKRILTATTVVLLVGLAGRLNAQLPQAQLDSIYPPGGKAGSQVDVKITGKDLEEAYQLRFSHDGITAEPRRNEPNDVEPNPKPIDNQFIVKIADNVPPGIYEVSAVGRFGISNTRAFIVGKGDEIVASGNQTSPESATDLPFGASVYSTVGNDQVNYYKIAAKKDQRILVDCFAERIDSSLDATLVLYGTDGHKLRTVRDSESTDPVLDFTAPADGDYVVGVYDFVYRGGADYFYRLSVTSTPWIDFVFPPAGQPGSNDQYTIYGRNLPNGSPVEGVKIDGAPLQQQQVNIALPAEPTVYGDGRLAAPHTAFVEGFVYRLDSPQGPSNPVAIGLAKAPVVKEQEPNNDGDTAAAVTLPVEYVGQLYPAGDVDCVSFEAKKGDTIWIDVLSHRLGASTDPVLAVQRVTKNGDNIQVSQVAEVDDASPPAAGNQFKPFDTGSKDPSYKLTVNDDATYRVVVRDLYGTSRGDPRFVYRLHISKPQPDFRLAAYAEPVKQGNGFRPTGVVVRRGGSTAVDIRIDRQHDYDGDIAITAEGLPAGVTCSETTVGGNATEAALVIDADENAAAWAGSIRVVGKANVGGKDVVRNAVPGTIVWESQSAQQQPIGGRTSQTIPLAVVDREVVPATVSVGDGSVVETSIGGKVEWPIKLTRRNNFKDDLKLNQVGLPGEFGAKDTTVKGDEGKYELALTNNKLVPGTYTFYLKGPAKFKYARIPEAQKQAEDEQKRLDEVVKQFDAKNKEAAEALNKAKQDKQPQDAVAALEEAAKKAADNLKIAQDLKKAADAAINNAKQQSQEKDLTTDVYSSAVRIRVAATPIVATVSPDSAAVKQGEKAQIKVAVERKYGFDDQVDVSIKGPAGVGGKLTIPKGQNEGMLEVSTAVNTPEGEQACTIDLQVKFNNVTLQSSETIKLNVTKAS